MLQFMVLQSLQSALTAVHAAAGDVHVIILGTVSLDRKKHQQICGMREKTNTNNIKHIESVHNSFYDTLQW